LAKLHTGSQALIGNNLICYTGIRFICEPQQNNRHVFLSQSFFLSCWTMRILGHSNGSGSGGLLALLFWSSSCISSILRSGLEVVWIWNLSCSCHLLSEPSRRKKNLSETQYPSVRRIFTWTLIRRRLDRTPIIHRRELNLQRSSKRSMRKQSSRF